MKMKLLGMCLSVSLLLPVPAMYGSGCGAENGRALGSALADVVLPKKYRPAILACNVAVVGLVAYYFYAKYSKRQQQKEMCSSNHKCCKHN